MRVCPSDRRYSPYVPYEACRVQRYCYHCACIPGFQFCADCVNEGLAHEACMRVKTEAIGRPYQ
eukprot:6514464-Pyramimonas_sp.AAC.1